MDATVKLKPGKDGPARAGHPWIFSGAIAEIDGEAPVGEADGSFGAVLDDDDLDEAFDDAYGDLDD